ncbi:MAG TPA: DUF4395 domain-containing protein [Streptosporangiales bacterium]
MRASEVFSFPNPVNEKAARVVAGGVVVLAAVTLATQWFWLLIPLAYGFVARVSTGPTLSPLGQLATRVVAPRLGAPRLVAGPPKRFAQGMGAAITVAAAVVWFGFGLELPTVVLLALIVVAATLESVFAFCIGCRVFAVLMRFGVVPEAVCEECNDITLRQAYTGATTQR